MRVEWPFIYSGANWLWKETYPPELNPVHFTLSEDEVLLSYAATIRRQLQHAGSSYELIGFGNVFTFPSVRSQGYGKQVVAAATDYILRGDADVAVLFCSPSLRSFYEKSGWEAFPDAITRIGAPDRFTPDPNLRMMLFVSERGRRARSAFAEQPLYIETPW